MRNANAKNSLGRVPAAELRLMLQGAIAYSGADSVSARIIKRHLDKAQQREASRVVRS